MAIRVITQPDSVRGSQRDPREDVVWRQRQARAAQEKGDAVETFKTEEVEVEDGPEDEKGKRRFSKVILRFAYDSPYIFAVYKDNPDFARRSRQEWTTLATDAIEKFFALRNLRVKMAPKPEDTNRYNVMAETDTAIEWAEDTVKRLEQIHAENEKIKKAREIMEAAGLSIMTDPLAGTPYRRIEG